MENDIRIIRRSVAVLLTVVVFVLAYFAKDLILPIMLGVLIALTLSPINRALQRFGLPASISATFLILTATITIGGAVFLAGETARSWTEDIPSIVEELKYKLSGVHETIEAVKDVSDQVDQIATDLNDGPQQVVIQQPGLINSAVTTLASIATSIGVAIVLALFLLASGDLFYVKLVQTFESMSEKKRALATVYDIERRVSGYLLTITLINAGLGVVIALALFALGLEYAYVWGVAAFLFNYLPILGGIAGTLLVGVHAVIFFDDLSYAVIIPITYQVLTSVEAQFVTPYLLGKRLELNIVVVFLTVILWAWLWGIAGVLVAVPFLLVFKVVCEHFESLNVIGKFLGVADDGVMREPVVE